MGSIVHSVDAASYHIQDGFVTFTNDEDVPVASFATTRVVKVELQGAVSDAGVATPPQMPAPRAGEWTTPAFGWDRPALTPEVKPGPSLPPVHQPLETQSWERWTDVWRPAPAPAPPQGVPPPAPDEPAEPVDEQAPAALEEPEEAAPAEAMAEEAAAAEAAAAEAEPLVPEA